jgi:hypothetical protein
MSQRFFVNVESLALTDPLVEVRTKYIYIYILLGDDTDESE